MDFHPIEINSRDDRRRFIELPWKIYHGDPQWVPPLIRDEQDRLDPRKNPFFEYGKVKLLGVCNHNHELVGRVAAVLNPVHQQLYHETAGFFGLFECVNQAAAAQTLMQAVKDYLQKSNCTHIAGPVNFNTNEESGFLVEGSDDSPMILGNYCPAYYPDLMAECGFEKAMDLLSYGARIDHSFPEKYARVLKRVAANPAITIRRSIDDALPKISPRFGKSITTALNRCGDLCRSRHPRPQPWAKIFCHSLTTSWSGSLIIRINPWALFSPCPT